MASLWANKGVRWVAMGWTGFIVENLVLSQNREEIIKNLGDDTYHYIYNTLSTATCGSIAFGLYKHGNTGPFLNKRLPIRALGAVVQTIGVVGLSQLAPAVQIPVWFGSPQQDTTSNG